MPPVRAISGNRESDLNVDLVIWNHQTRLGKVFSSSTIFTLPNGGKRSPDVVLTIFLTLAAIIFPVQVAKFDQIQDHKKETEKAH